MAKVHVNFKLSETAFSVLQLHQADLTAVQHKQVDRTDALEDILLKFKNQQHSPLAEIKRVFRNHPSDEKSVPLEAFKTA